VGFGADRPGPKSKPYAGRVLALATVFLWLVAVLLFVSIMFVGLAVLRAVSGSRPVEKIEPEDVASLDVYFVCEECGTEYQVTRLGEVQVPRHCGEPMSVVRRPRQQPLAN
jgi:hypothetical protein